MRFSVVIPVHNERDNVAPLVEDIERLLDRDRPLEIIFVDDASTDGTAARVRELADTHPTVRLIQHPWRCGQSAGLWSGIKAARAPWIVTLDGDGQNDPQDIPRLLAMARTHHPPALVGGLRRKRHSTLSRRLASRLANQLRQAMLGDGCADTGCGLKLIRRDSFLDLPYFDAMHRFLPALMRMHGQQTAFAPVNDRPRRHGQSKYGNLGRAFVGMFDLLGVYWLKRRTNLPVAVEEAPARAAAVRGGAPKAVGGTR